MFRARSRPVCLLGARGGDAIPLERLQGARSVCFAGIARPERFFEDARASGAAVAATLPFPNHHRFTPSDIEGIRRAAREGGARVILTTEKDLARLDEPRRRALGDELHAIRMETTLDEPDLFAALLAGVVP